MRPIVSLSPIVKLLEGRFVVKLTKYLTERMNIAQTGFVPGCGTQVNIQRLIKKCSEKRKKGIRAAVLFVDFKSAYNNVNIGQLFSILKEKHILDNNEIDFLRALYSNVTVTVGKEKVKIFKGVMQGSVISPALFNIFIEPLLDSLCKELGWKNVFAYADDVAVIVTSYQQLRTAVNTITAWSKGSGVPLNFQKSGILNVRSRRNSGKLIGGNEFMGMPVVGLYKYLGVWLDEVLDPQAHVQAYEAKVKFLNQKLMMIPKRCVTPKLLINLWSLIIRPVFDYSMNLALANGRSKLGWYLTQARKSFKKVLRLRKSTSNEIINALMGYDPRKFAEEQVRVAEEKWESRRRRASSEDDQRVGYRLPVSNVLVSWELLKMNNILFNKCKRHNCLITQAHLAEAHRIHLLPDILQVMREGWVIEKRLERTKRRGRVLQAVEVMTERFCRIYDNCCNEILR